MEEVNLYECRIDHTMLQLVTWRKVTCQASSQGDPRQQWSVTL
jgi:hypothetical protein